MLGSYICGFQIPERTASVQILQPYYTLKSSNIKKWMQKKLNSLPKSCKKCKLTRN